MAEMRRFCKFLLQRISRPEYDPAATLPEDWAATGSHRGSGFLAESGIGGADGLAMGHKFCGCISFHWELEVRMKGIAHGHAVLKSVVVGSGIALLSGVVHGAALNPGAYSSLGTLSVSSGTLVFNTNALTITGGGAGLVSTSGVIQSQAGGPNVAVFDFSDVSVGSGV